MAEEKVPFEHVPSYLNEHGWELMRISKPYRVFEKPGHLPILIVVEDKMVDIEYVRKAKNIVEKEQGE